MDFSSIPYPPTPSYVVAQADFRGDETKNQLSFLKGDKLLVLRVKPGAPWGIGERVGSEARGMYPVQFCAEAGAPGNTLRASNPAVPVASVSQAPRPVATQPPASAIAVRGTPLVQVPPSAKRASVGPTSSIRPVAGPEPAPTRGSSGGRSASVVSPVSSPRVQPGQTTVRADFSLPHPPQYDEEEADEGEANANVFSGAAFASGDGLRWEFEREPEKHVMEVDKKKKVSKRRLKEKQKTFRHLLSLPAHRRLRVQFVAGC
jgi:hypothetical protein